MTYQDGQTLSVMGKTFSVSDVTNMYVDNSDVTNNTVNVSYNGTEYSNYTGNTDYLSSDQKSSPKGIKVDGNVDINGGTINVSTTASGGFGNHVGGGPGGGGGGPGGGGGNSGSSFGLGGRLLPARWPNCTCPIACIAFLFCL